jgi:hypothetical protein
MSGVVDRRFLRRPFFFCKPLVFEFVLLGNPFVAPLGVNLQIAA